MRKMKKIRWGLLCTANINRRVIPAIHLSERGELAAVASRSLDRAQDYARRWEIPQAFGSYQSMLDSDAVDAVYISMPNHLHAEWSIRALQAGKHVLCEKPLAISLEEVDRMIAASRETGCYLAEAFMYRHHPQMKLAGEWVRSGRLGEISVVQSAFHFKIHSREDVRLVPEYGGGCLWDVGVYPMSVSQYIFGARAEWVTGAQWTGDSGVDESFAGVLHYPGGGMAVISSSFRTPYYTFVDITGTEGRLSLNRPFNRADENARMVFTPVDGDPVDVSYPHTELYLGEVEDLQAAVLDGAQPYLRLEESRSHIHTILALYESARSGQPVRL
jgi:D-xylose 1-dehydrogenase (NADP+, D-xylono-1,5-lactone-forming)